MQKCIGELASSRGEREPGQPVGIEAQPALDARLAPRLGGGPEVEEGGAKKTSLATEPQPARCWLSMKTAAEYLDMSPDALRRTLERHAVRARDGGGVEANIDGVRAREFGRLWRIQFSSRWSSEVTP